MSKIEKIIVSGSGVTTSDGEYVRAEEGTLWFEGSTNENSINLIQQFGWFTGPNNNHIEPTVDGWYLIDKVVDDQTYMFDHDFQSVIAVGDAIEPIPSFELVYSE